MEINIGHRGGVLELAGSLVLGLPDVGVAGDVCASAYDHMSSFVDCYVFKGAWFCGCWVSSRTFMPPKFLLSFGVWNAGSCPVFFENH